MTTAPGLGASYVTLSGSGFVDPSPYPLVERLRAARTAGFDTVGVRLSDLHSVDGGVEAAIELVKDNGLPVSEVEFLAGWALADEPTTALAATPAIHRLAEAWGPFHLTAGEFGAGHLDPERAARNLRLIADELDGSGVRIAVEAFAWSAIRDYDTALDLVRRSGSDAVGIMLDIWHFANTGGTADWLREIEPQSIAGVQINDGPRVDDDFLVRARTTRWLPGDGELDVPGILTGVAELGFVGSYLVEVSYPEFLDLRLDEAARQAQETGRTALGFAGLD